MADITKKFSQDQIADLVTALDTHLAYLKRQTSYKEKPGAVRDIYEREAKRFEQLRLVVAYTA